MSLELDTATPFRGQSLAGLRFNRWTVLQYAGRQVTKTAWHYYWKCRCDCGMEKTISAANLKSKSGSAVKSCGCLNAEITTARNTTHGLAVTGSQHPLFKIWNGMKQRCYNPKNPAYKNYGGRGIFITPEWIDSFKQFYDDMLPTWTLGLSIDRKNNDGPYSKENCKWSTDKEQMNNMRRNRLVVFQGKTLTVTQAAELAELPARIVSQRLNALGWSEELALTTPLQSKFSPK